MKYTITITGTVDECEPDLLSDDIRDALFYIHVRDNIQIDIDEVDDSDPSRLAIDCKYNVV